MSDYTAGKQFALDIQGLEKLRYTAARTPQAGVQAAAEQFEALFLQIMLKSMREAGPQSGLLSSEQTRFYEELMDQQWAQSLAGKGIGLAEKMIRELDNSR